MDNVNNNNNVNNYRYEQTNKTNERITEETVNSLFNDFISTAAITLADELFNDGKGNFTTDEAKVFVEAELEISKIVKDKKDKQGIFEFLLSDDNTLLKESREEYAKSHPEYKKVMEEGIKIQEEHDEALEELKKYWNSNNPEPKFGDDNKTFSFNESQEHKDWSKKKNQQIKKFEEIYEKNHPKYRTLKKEQNAHKSFIDIMFSA